VGFSDGQYAESGERRLFSTEMAKCGESSALETMM